MSKKRHTRKEKLVAQSRRMAQSFPQYSISDISVKSQDIALQPAIKPQVAPHSYSYVISDIQHTLIVTLLILLLNSILFVLLQKHVVNIPFLGF